MAGLKALLVLLCCSFSALAAGPATIDKLRQQAATGSELLRQTFMRQSNWLRVQQEYEKAHQQGAFRVRNTSAAQEVKNLAKKLTHVVSRKMRAIKEVVTFAEGVAANYISNPAIEAHQVSYIDAKLVDENDPRMQYDRMFLQQVVKNQSSVHIPVETYNGDVKVLNDIAWSSELDKVFSSNKKRDSELLWQFYGSQNGFFRIFPGMKWRVPKGKIDRYDVRRRPWYTQGSASPRDVLFMVDTSGSMHGQALGLTKLAVASLIDTLGENDFVAVAQYPGRQVTTDHTAKPHLLKDGTPEDTKSNGTCFRTFVQATKRNKDRLFAQINDLAAYGIVNFYEAIDFAYSMFEEFYESPINNHGAMCNSMIMIFTDGDVSDSMEETRQMIRTWRNRSSLLDKIRIFTYSVGQHQNPTEPLLEVACSNRGYFAEIPAMGAVTSQVQHITTVLSRPMTLYEAEYYLWHNIYLDSLGLGLMTSLTMPLYNTSGNQSFLGLIGTDVTVKEMQAMVPYHKFGPNGYAFAINSNGYIVFHPELKAQYGWLRDSPNVDLIEVEFDSELKREVRKRIIETTGSTNPKFQLYEETIPNFLKISDSIHTYWAERNYAFTNVNRTAFAISVVLPPSGNRYVDFSSTLAITINRQRHANASVDSFVTFIDVADNRGFYPSRRAQFPSRRHDYLVSSKTPYCREYFIPPPPTPPQPPPPPPPNQQTPPQARRLRRSPQEHEWRPLQPLPTSLASVAEATSTTAAPTAKTPQPPNKKTDGGGAKETVEHIRHAPADMANLLETLMHNRSACDEHWVRAVAVDMALYEELFSEMTVAGSTASSVFVTGPSGLMGVLPAAEAPRYRSWREGWFEGYYQRAFERPDLIFASVVPFKSGEVIPQPAGQSEPVFSAFGVGAVSTTASTVLPIVSDKEAGPPDPPPVTLFQAVTMPPDNFKVAVAGVTLSWRWISESIFNSTFGSLCNLQLANNTCYLLEDGGYIVSANKRHEVIGHFLGHVDKPLMRHLIYNLSVYGSVQEYDYQGSCTKQESQPTKKSAPLTATGSLTSIALHLLLSPALGCLATAGVSPQRQLLTLPLPSLLWLAQAALGQESTSSENAIHSCIKLGYRYYREPQGRETFQSADSLGRSVTVLFLNGTNLLLVAVGRSPAVDPALLLATEPNDGASDDDRLDFTELLREPREDPGPDVCSMESRFRMRPSSCYRWHPKEDSSECGSGAAILPTVYLLVVTVAVGSSAGIYSFHLLT